VFVHGTRTGSGTTALEESKQKKNKIVAGSTDGVAKLWA